MVRVGYKARTFVLFLLTDQPFSYKMTTRNRTYILQPDLGNLCGRDMPWEIAPNTHSSTSPSQIFSVALAPMPLPSWANTKTRKSCPYPPDLQNSTQPWALAACRVVTSPSLLAHRPRVSAPCHSNSLPALMLLA